MYISYIWFQNWNIGYMVNTVGKNISEALISYVANLADTLSSYNVRSKLQRNKYSLMVQEIFSRND